MHSEVMMEKRSFEEYFIIFWNVMCNDRRREHFRFVSHKCKICSIEILTAVNNTV
jgi:hypothetical protein